MRDGARTLQIRSKTIRSTFLRGGKNLTFYSPNHSSDRVLAITKKQGANTYQRLILNRYGKAKSTLSKRTTREGRKRKEKKSRKSRKSDPTRKDPTPEQHIRHFTGRDRTIPRRLASKKQRLSSPTQRERKRTYSAEEAAEPGMQNKHGTKDSSSIRSIKSNGPMWVLMTSSDRSIRRPCLRRTSAGGELAP
ncbi:hypothetical protein FNV43_RR06596 [Rhamnella rubrinervis]|uniref:Uncharacterized protein n=1 Tax=Rhamnella rubrinervis TaxID=2594499 RepID=A0A8K0HD92_9ROSA|nr:hypothetical protein FNV43_RR06596 [Rhamnella rubrinervis]